MIRRLYRKWQYVKRMQIIRVTLFDLFGVHLTEQQIIDGLKRVAPMIQAQGLTAEDAVNRMDMVARALHG